VNKWGTLSDFDAKNGKKFQWFMFFREENILIGQYILLHIGNCQ